MIQQQEPRPSAIPLQDFASVHLGRVGGRSVKGPNWARQTDVKMYARYGRSADIPISQHLLIIANKTSELRLDIFIIHP